MYIPEMRITAAGEGSPLGDVVLRAMEQGNGELSIRNLRAPGFRALAPLFDKAQVAIDQAVVEVGQERLTFVADLMSENLVYNLTDPLSVTQLEWYKRKKTGAAQRVMDPNARTEDKKPTTLPFRLPIYLTIDGFTLDIRSLKMSQRIGVPLDTTLIKDCTRSVNEAIEDAAINGATTLDGEDLAVAGYEAPGLLNAPNKATYDIVTAWDDATARAALTIGAKILTDVQSMIALAAANFKYGPYNLYIGTAYGIALGDDFKANGDRSILARLQEIEAGGRKLRVRVADKLPAHTVALVQMTSDVVEVVKGQAPTVIPWTSLNGMTIHNLVMGIMIPRVRSDANGKSGIVIGTYVP